LIDNDDARVRAEHQETVPHVVQCGIELVFLHAQQCGGALAVG
jgi:hypothetical protein